MFTGLVFTIRWVVYFCLSRNRVAATTTTGGRISTGFGRFYGTAEAVFERNLLFVHSTVFCTAQRGVCLGFKTKRSLVNSSLIDSNLVEHDRVVVLCGGVFLDRDKPLATTVVTTKTPRNDSLTVAKMGRVTVAEIRTS